MNVRSRRLLAIIAAIIAAALLVALALRVVDRASDVTWWLNYPYPREGSEGLTMYEAWLARSGENIYAPPTAARFISAPYPPLYYYFSGALLDPANPGFPPGRWLSLFAALAAALIAGLLAAVGLDDKARPSSQQGVIYHAPTDTNPPPTQNSKLKTQNYLTAMVAALLFATSYPNLIWAARFRADMLALALMAGGLLAVQLRPRGWGAWVGAGLFALAFFTKQTALAGPLAAALYLLLLGWQTRRGREGRGVSLRGAWLWMAGLAALCILPTLLFTALSGGGYWAKLVTYHNLPFSPRTLSSLLAALGENHWPLVILAAAYLVLVIARLRQGYTPTIVAPYLIAAALLLPTGGVVGADSNHLLAVCLALVVASGQLVGYIMAAIREGVGGSRPYLAGIAICLALALYLLASGQAAGWYGLDLRRPSDQQQAQLGRIINNVRQNPGPAFLSDEVGLLVLAGKRPAYDDLFDLTALANAGRWDQSALLQQVRDGKFGIILLHNPVAELRGDILTDQMRQAITARYKLLFADIWYTYVPK